MSGLDSNFYGDDGKFYMVRCPKCKRENWLPAVADGRCAWCGYKGEDKKPKMEKKK
jgi:ssDNA-binding Zn-finger/Zn-ribbon topoisomerase 1